MKRDAIVVGAGVVGAAVADALTAEGANVLVIEAHFPASGATAAGMGHIVVMDDSPAQLALTALSRGIFDDLSAELPPSCELDRCGTLWIAANDEELAVASMKAERCIAAGVAAGMLDAAALADAEPNLRPGLAGAVHVPGDSVVYPPALCTFLLGRATDRGARVIRDTPVLRIEPHTVVTRDGRHEADVIVNAAGMHAPQLTPGLPILPRRGHLVITDRHPGFCRHQLVELGYMRSAHTMTAESVAFNVQPRRTGQVLVGSARELTDDPSINRDIVARMLRRAAEFMPRIGELTAIRTWTGVRPATADKLPLIGAWSAVAGLWIAAGHEGLGITTALGTARILVDLLHDRTPPIDARPFAAARVVAAAAT
jgi:glycine/D-amino acid oxidase-like deaminating enzyme